VSFADEVRAVGGVKVQCKTCEYLASLDLDDRADVEAVVADRSYSERGISMAFRKRGVSIGKTAVGSHRRDHVWASDAVQ
jgi:hypothetical protein